MNIRHTLTIITGFVCAFSLSLTAVAANGIPSPTTTNQSLDKIVAIVNSGVITQSDLYKGMTRARKQINATHHLMPPAGILQADVLKQLIYQKLQLQLAEKYKIKVTEAQVDQALSRIAKQNHASIKQLAAKVTRQGSNMKAFRTFIKQQIKIQMLQQQAVSGLVSVTPAQIAAFKEKYLQQSGGAAEYHLVDILIPANVPNQQAVAKANKIKQALQSGTSLAAIAKQYPNIAVSDLGWQPASGLPSLFAKQLPKMSVKGFTGPVQAPNGYHILNLVAQHASTAKLPSNQQLEQMVFQQNFEKALVKWLKKMRQQAYVKIMS